MSSLISQAFNQKVLFYNQGVISNPNFMDIPSTDLSKGQVTQLANGNCTSYPIYCAGFSSVLFEIGTIGYGSGAYLQMFTSLASKPPNVNAQTTQDNVYSDCIYVANDTGASYSLSGGRYIFDVSTTKTFEVNTNGANWIVFTLLNWNNLPSQMFANAYLTQ